MCACRFLFRASATKYSIDPAAGNANRCPGDKTRMPPFAPHIKFFGECFIRQPSQPVSCCSSVGIIKGTLIILFISLPGIM